MLLDDADIARVARHQHERCLGGQWADRELRAALMVQNLSADETELIVLSVAMERARLRHEAERGRLQAAYDAAIAETAASAGCHHDEISLGTTRPRVAA